MSATEFAAIVAQVMNAVLMMVQQAPPQVQSVELVLVQLPTIQEWVRDAFQKAHPSEFSGCSDIAIARQWKMKIKRHLCMCKWSDIQK